MAEVNDIMQALSGGPTVAPYMPSTSSPFEGISQKDAVKMMNDALDRLDKLDSKLPKNGGAPAQFRAPAAQQGMNPSAAPYGGMAASNMNAASPLLGLLLSLYPRELGNGELTQGQRFQGYSGPEGQYQPYAGTNNGQPFTSSEISPEQFGPMKFFRELMAREAPR